MWFQDRARDHANKNTGAGAPQNQITFETLIITGQFDTIKAQTQYPPLLHGQLKTVALKASDKIIPQEKITKNKPTGSYTKILQGPSENYADFLTRLQTAISCTVIGEKAKRQLKKLLAYENANQECQKAVTPIHETETIIDYLKACHNLRSETQKMQMLAETMGASLRKQNKGCFTCGDKYLQKSASTAIEKCIEPKIVNLNLTLKGNLFRETPSRGPPLRSPSTKTWGEFHLFPKTLNIRQCCH